MIKSVSKEAVKYTPVYAGNREDDNSLWVMLHSLNRAEMEKYIKQTRYFQKAGSSKGEWDTNALQTQKKQFLDNVIEVHNFIDSDTNEEIKDVARLYEEAPHQLVEEILQAIVDISTMKDSEIKN